MRTKEEATTTITVMMVHDDTADTCANGASVLYKNVSWTSRIENAMDLRKDSSPTSSFFTRCLL